MIDASEVKLRKGETLSIERVIALIEEAGHPEILVLPAWAWTVIAMHIRLDAVVRPEGEDAYFWVGATKCVPALPPERLRRVYVKEYDSGIVLPDTLAGGRLN